MFIPLPLQFHTISWAKNKLIFLYKIRVTPAMVVVMETSTTNNAQRMELHTYGGRCFFITILMNMQYNENQTDLSGNYSTGQSKSAKEKCRGFILFLNECYPYVRKPKLKISWGKCYRLRAKYGKRRLVASGYTAENAISRFMKEIREKVECAHCV